MIRSVRFAPMVALVLAGGVACSAVSSARPPVAAPTSAPATAPQVSARAPVAAAGASTGAAQPAVTAANPATSDAAPNASDSALPDTSAQVLDRMVIRTAQLALEVQDLESALSQVRTIAGKAGGFVSASNTHVEQGSGQPDRMVADLTLQVRSDSADSAISDLRALGKVTSENTGSQDVTDEYVDLDANLRNLQASEAAILKLMDRATQIQDIISLQRELTNVRGQIERIQGRKTYLERRTDMATITVSLRLPPIEAAAANAAWDPLGNALRGWQASLSVLRGIIDVLIVVLAFSWWLIPFVALGGYVLLHRRAAPAPELPGA